MNRQTIKVVNGSGSGSRSTAAVISYEVLRLEIFALFVLLVLILSSKIASRNLIEKSNEVFNKQLRNP